MAPRLTEVREGPPRSPGDLKEVEDSEPLPPVDVFVALDFEAFVAFEGGFAEKIFSHLLRARFASIKLWV